MLLTDISWRGGDGHTSQHQTASAVLVQAVQDILHTGFYIVHVTVGQHTVLVHQLKGKNVSRVSFEVLQLCLIQRDSHCH